MDGNGDPAWQDAERPESPCSARLRTFNGLAQVLVQSTSDAGGISPVVVENPVCDIARLLNFNQEIALPYSVDANGGKKEHIAGLSVIFTESIHDGGVLYLAPYALWCFLRLETVVEVCAFFGGDAVPHLCLAALTFKAGSHFVVGMKNRMDIQYGSSAQMRDEFSRSHKGQLLDKQRHCEHLHQM